MSKRNVLVFGARPFRFKDFPNCVVFLNSKRIKPLFWERKQPEATAKTTQGAFHIFRVKRGKKCVDLHVVDMCE